MDAQQLMVLVYAKVSLLSHLSVAYPRSANRLPWFLTVGLTLVLTTPVSSMMLIPHVSSSNPPALLVLRGQNGCWQATEVWDCGTDVVVPNTSATDTYVLTGAVQCLNGSCLQPSTEPSGDFNKAVATLQAATYALNEMKCGDDTDETNRSCTLFKGESAQCKSAMGGWVDCCDQPVDVNWIQYLQLSYYTLKIADAVAVKAGMFEQGKGIFDMGSELMTNAIDTITRPAISAFNSLVGTAGTEAAQQATEAGLSGLMNQAIGALTKQVAQWTLDTFGPAATNMLLKVRLLKEGPL